MNYGNSAFSMTHANKVITINGRVTANYGRAAAVAPKATIRDRVRSESKQACDIINAKGICDSDIKSYAWHLRHGDKISNSHVIALLWAEESKGSGAHRRIAQRLANYYGNGAHDRISAKQEIAVIFFCSFDF